MSSSDVSSVTSHFSVAAEGFITTTSGSISSGAATIPLTSVSGLTNGNIFVGIIEPGLTKEQTFTGTVDTTGTQLTGVVWTRGSNAAHSAGVTIVDYVTGTGHNMFTKGLLVAHNQDGTHKTSIALTTPKITTSINDSSGNEVIKTPATASATNEITVTNAANGSAPKISATGSSDTNVALNLVGKGTGSVQINGQELYASFFDHVISGCVITADSAGVNKNYSISSGVVNIGGNPLTVAAVSAQTVGASKDRYVDLTDNGDGTAVYVTNEVANNAASQALTAGNMRLGIVVAGATTIANAASINQGQETSLLPIISSRPLAVTDSIGNLICPRDPNRKILGNAQTTSSLSTASTSVQVSAILICPVIIPTGRKIKISFSADNGFSSSATGYVEVTVWDGVAGSGTQLKAFVTGSTAINGQAPMSGFIVLTPSATTKTYAIGYRAVVAGTATVTAGASDPIVFTVELV